MLSVGIPKEIKPLEKRVGLIPSAVKILCEKGIKIFLQTGAGSLSGYTDEAYEKSGAEILRDAKALFAKSDLILKVKEPQPSEYDYFRADQILFCFLHLASPDHCELVKALTRNHVLAIGFETVQEAGRFPLLAPMSEIAGSLAAAYAGVLHGSDIIKVSKLDSSSVLKLLESAAEKFPDYSGLPSPGRAVIFGGGVAGFQALETALKLKSQVCVIEKDAARREFLKRFVPDVFSPDRVPQSILEKAETLIGCVHSRGARAFSVLSEKKIREISQNQRKILVDISIDQGGNFPGSHPTTYENPVYFDELRNLRFCVANMPSLCGRGASEVLSNALLPYVTDLAEDPEKAFRHFPSLKDAINIQAGKICLEEIRQAHQMES